MKKIVCLLCCIACLGMFAPAHADAIVEIKENMFLTQLNDIMLNADDYLGKTIRLEGLLGIYPYGEEGAYYAYIYRFTPGCCGADGMAGLEIAIDAELPEDGAWVSATGVLELYYEEDVPYLRLALTELTALASQGATFVSR